MMNYLIINDFQTTFLPMGFVVNEWAKFKFKRNFLPEDPKDAS